MDDSAQRHPTLSGHGRIVCICGIVIAQCRCINHGNNLETRSPCTHQRVAVGDFDRTRSRTRYIIRDSHAERTYVTGEGLAFAVGVACMEVDLTHDPKRLLQVCHPNGLALYNIVWIGGQTIVTKVGT